jgi:hypothetical protein
MISTISVDYDVAAHASLVKPYGNSVQVGMPAKGEVTINNFVEPQSRAIQYLIDRRHTADAGSARILRCEQNPTRDSGRQTRRSE